MDLTEYNTRLSGAVNEATDFLQKQNYIDPISRRLSYHVKTVLPGAPDVRLTYGGLFKLTQRHHQLYHTEVDSFVKAESEVRHLTPTELLEFVVETAEERGSTFPSRLPLEGVLDRLIHEMEVLPQVLALEMQGRLSETKELLRVN